jgi:uncharacterized protein YbjT (DUF2867 family)
MNMKIIVTGSSGMVGEGVLRVCLDHPDVENILVINRRPATISSPKIKEIIHQNFFDLSPIEDQLKGYNACFYCIGTTSILLKESAYYEITHNLTLSVAETLARLNSEMIFCYISGFGANTKSKVMQTRVKGATEEALFKTSVKKVYSFRPGLLRSSGGQKNIHKVYYLFNPFYHVFRFLFPGFVLSLEELGQAMINSVTIGYEKQILEVRDILTLSKIK